MRLAYSFRGSVHYHHGRKHGSILADMVGEEPRVLHLDQKAASRRLSSKGSQAGALIPLARLERIYDLQAPPPQPQTSSNKAASPPIKSHLLIVPLPIGQAYSNHYTFFKWKSFSQGS